MHKCDFVVRRNPMIYISIPQRNISTMKASETKFSKIIEGTNQYLIPHFQRPYTWKQKNWDTLWKDIEMLLSEDVVSTASSEHFMGAIVTAPAHSVPEGVTKYLLIDGQQRVTTLLLLLTAIRDRAKQIDDSKLSNRIHELYLTNRYQDDLDQYKLLPTQGDESKHNDRASFIKIILGEDSSTAGGALHNAYQYFTRLLRDFSAEKLNTLATAILSHIFLVSITLEQDDNHYAIFESLNAKGEPLSQSDLVRNFFFMRIDDAYHDSIYKEKWRPMECLIKRENMEMYLRHFLIKNGAIVKEADVYYTFKKKIEGNGQAESLLDELVKFSKCYVKFLDAEQEKSIQVRARLVRLQRLRATVCYPFLLNIFDDRATNRISDQEVVDILDIIENFIVRRYVCGTIRAELNEVFTALYRQVSEFSKIVDGIRDVLGSRNYPSDQEFCESLKTRKLYSIGGRDTRDRAKLILEQLEAYLGNKEPVITDKLTIEHIMPQKLTAWWKEHLGNAAEETHEIYLHTIGNLTLTGYNSELSNAEFSRKVMSFRQSNLALNRDIANLDCWTRDEIDGRAKTLANYALKVWPDFAPNISTRRQPSFRGTRPKQLLVFGETFACKTWQDVLRITITQISKNGDETTLEQLIKGFPRHVRRSATGLRSPKSISDDLFYESHGTADSIYRLCSQIIQAIGYSFNEWRVETEAS